MRTQRAGNRWRVVVILALAFLLAPLSGLPAAKSEAEIEAAVREVLLERHPKVDPSWWRELGPSAPTVIIRMAEEAQRLPERVRLVQALGYFDDPLAIEYLKKQAQESDQDVIRTASVRTVGSSQGAKEVEFVSRFLRHPDAQTRLAAAESLSAIADPQAKEILRKYFAEEKTSWIVAKVKDQLPAPTQSLNPVTSSEDRLSPEFTGTWRGYWLEPAASGLKSLTAVAELQGQGTNGLMGELKLQVPGGIARALKLGKVVGRANRFNGNWTEGKTTEWSGEAELSLAGRSRILRMAFPKAGVTLVLKKD